MELELEEEEEESASGDCMKKTEPLCTALLLVNTQCETVSEEPACASEITPPEEDEKPLVNVIPAKTEGGKVWRPSACAKHG